MAHEGGCRGGREGWLADALRRNASGKVVERGLGERYGRRG